MSAGQTPASIAAAISAIRVAVIADLAERFGCPAQVIEAAIHRGGHICHEFKAAMNQAAVDTRNALEAA